MSHDLTDPIATEHHALDRIHAALADAADGLTIGKLAAATGYGRAYLLPLLAAPYFYRAGYRWKADVTAVDGALLATLAARFSNGRG